MGKHIHLNNVRISYPSLYAPRVSTMYPNSKPKYEATFLVDDKADPTIIPQILAAIQEITVAEFGGVKQKDPTWKVDPTTGVTSIAAKSDSRPTVVDDYAQPMTALNDKIYAGCRVKAVISVYKHSFGTGGISFGLEGCQFVADDERLDGKADLTGVFAPVNPNVVQPAVNAAGMPAVAVPAAVAPVAAAPVAAVPAAVAPVAAAVVPAAPPTHV